MNVKAAVGLALVSCAVSIVWAPSAGAVNLLSNPGFELGTTSSWSTSGGTLTAFTGASDANAVHSGSYGALASDRTEARQGPVQSFARLAKNGKYYRLSAWVKLQGDASDQAAIAVTQTDGAGTSSHDVVRATVSGDRWTNLSGLFKLDVTGTLTALDFCVAGPRPGVGFYVDDANAEEITDWREVVAARTEPLRQRQMILTILGPDGLPVGEAAVHARQVKHQFAFGSCINSNISSKSYADFFRTHFEWAVCENESKWYTNEAQQGQVTYAAADSIYAWCKQNGITMRGHCLYWDADNTIQGWLKALSTDQLRAAVESRMESAVPHFKGKFVHWDINNEMVPNHYFENRLGDDIRLYMFNRAHELDPNAVLFVNEYNVIEGGYSMNGCIQLVQWLQARGAPVQAVGAQCHFSTGYDRWTILNRFDKLATLGLPIWCTEFDMQAPDEYTRANDIEDFYRIAFSHPAVQGILMWGFWESSHWKKNCYIVNADWSLNEAGRRYEALLKEWTTDTQDVADANGVMTFRGFHGSYEIVIAPPTIRRGWIVTIDLPPGDQPAAATIQLDAAGGATVRKNETVSVAPEN